MFIEHSAHCRRLWVVEVSCQVQVNFLTKVITFLIWKCHFFPLIFEVDVFLSNWHPDISTSRNCRHSVQKAVDLTTPGKNRDKMSGKKWHFQIKKMIVFFRKLTWTWQLTSTTHSLPQCALCLIKISQEVLVILSFHHPTPFFPYLLVKNIIFWGCTEPGSNLENHHFFHWILVK